MLDRAAVTDGVDRVDPAGPRDLPRIDDARGVFTPEATPIRSIHLGLDPRFVESDAGRFDARLREHRRARGRGEFEPAITVR